jgi:uncharacterized protein (TIGR03067 family)
MRFRTLSSLFLVVAWTAAPAPAQAPGSPLTGTWEITAVIDNGELIPEAKIPELWVQDARIYISGQMLSFIRPGNRQRRDLLFVADPNANPKTIDVAGTTDRIGAKGIYYLDRSSLFLCIAGPDKKERPTEFASRVGSNNILMILKKIDGNTSSPPPQQWTPAPVPAPKAMGPPPDPDAYNRRMLIGNWGHQDGDKVEMMTFNPDGTFSGTRTWKKGFQRMFHEGVRSSGIWRVENGIVVVTITASTEADLRNQIYSYRISSISPADVVYLDQQGRVRREWRVP